MFSETAGEQLWQKVLPSGHDYGLPRNGYRRWTMVVLLTLLLLRAIFVYFLIVSQSLEQTCEDSGISLFWPSDSLLLFYMVPSIHIVQIKKISSSFSDIQSSSVVPKLSKAKTQLVLLGGLQPNGQ